ncbi:MAG TPA: SBBP repeat-containing protein [Bryobacteraceae bacterium]|nr:SBBP repeat-containing protein [Bryobacteraceae bacterium]
MATDQSGNVYVAGSTVVSLTPGGAVANKVLVAKLDRANNLTYRYIFGGTGGDFPRAVALQTDGSLVVVGTTGSSDFPLINPASRNAPPVNGTGFISKVDPAGKHLVFSTFLGGPANDGETEINAVAVDAVGNVYVTGATRADHFPVTPNAFQTEGPFEDLQRAEFAFITKLSPSGSLLYSTYLGDNHAICYGGSRCESASGITQGFAIAVGNDGAITVAGSTSADKFPVTAGAFQTDCKCTYQTSTGFVTRFSSDGTRLEWSTFLGGSGNADAYLGDQAEAIALASDGGVVVGGAAASPDFPVTPNAFQSNLRATGGYGLPQNIFVARLNATGSALKFSTLLGGSIREDLNALQLDTQEHVWLTGTTRSRDFPVLPGSLTLGTSFVVELASDGSGLLKTQMLPVGGAGLALAVDTGGNKTLLGSAGSLLRLPPGSPTGTSIFGQANAAGPLVSGFVAPGEIVSFYGTGLGPIAGVGARFDSTGKIATMLAGTQVLFDGKPAPLLYVGANQINAIVPFEVSSKTLTTVQVVSGLAASPTLNLSVEAGSPEVFSIPWSPPIPVDAVFPYAAALNEDGTVNSPSNPAKPGSIVVVYVNGAGLFVPALVDGSIVRSASAKPVLNVSVLVGAPGVGGSAEVLYAGAAPDLVAGALQVNVRLPRNAAEYFLQVQVGNFMSDVVQIAVQQ